MTHFKKEAEEWAKKELEKHPFNKESQDFLELFTFGSIGYATDKNGNRRKLSRRELWDLRTEELFNEIHDKKDELHNRIQR